MNFQFKAVGFPHLFGFVTHSPSITQTICTLDSLFKIFTRFYAYFLEILLRLMQVSRIYFYSLNSSRYFSIFYIKKDSFIPTQYFNCSQMHPKSAIQKKLYVVTSVYVNSRIYILLRTASLVHLDLLKLYFQAICFDHGNL